MLVTACHAMLDATPPSEVQPPRQGLTPFPIAQLPPMSPLNPDSEDGESPEESPPRGNQRQPARSPSQLKRQRSVSAASHLTASHTSHRITKRHPARRYNDAYRKLFNDVVMAAAMPFTIDGSFRPNATQIGGVQWSTKEKSTFFAALERLGKDDVPGIAKAIGTKSIPETRQFLLFVQEAVRKRRSERRDADVTLQDIPAAAEVSLECEARLDLTAEFLAWRQELHEAKEEQERYGPYWLITPEIADEIEEAISSSPPPTARSSVVPNWLGARDQDEESGAGANTPVPGILQDIPEAAILVPATFLHLSKHFFMNPFPSSSYPWPHWTELTSKLAAEPSLYRTALRDFHTLVVSLTRRLVQTTIIQATSRIRSQGWRTKKGVKPFVNPKDVLTAIDLLGMPRNGRERWKGVARRCALNVQAVRRPGDLGRSRKKTRDMTWDEVERVLGDPDSSVESFGTDVETAGPTSGTDDEHKSLRAVRSNTPLPSAAIPAGRIEDSSLEEPGEDDTLESDAYQPPDDCMSDSSRVSTSTTTTFSRNHAEDELEAIEDFDRAASHREERYLCTILDMTVGGEQEVSNAEEEIGATEARGFRRRVPGDAEDWRPNTPYRAEWEEFRALVPPSSFLANRKKPSFTYAFSSQGPSLTDTEEGTEDSSTLEDRHRRRKRTEPELTIRGTREYAALQESALPSGHQDYRADISDDGADVPTQSIESVDDGEYDAGAASSDAMDWTRHP